MTSGTTPEPAPESPASHNGDADVKPLQFAAESEPILILPPAPARRRRRWPLVVAVVALIVAGVVYYEMEHSTIQARFISSLAADMRYSVEPGPASEDEIHYPGSGPFDVRMGYTALPDFLTALHERGYLIDSQARWSAGLQRSWEWGLFPIYHEKTRAGLIIHDRNGVPLHDSRYPRQTYAAFEEIAPLIVDTLLFIENRELLDSSHPHRNPAVEWDRMARVTGDLALNIIRTEDEKLAGGSTLATQIEKYRHSPDGLTSTPVEKLRQMGSATLRAYLDGEDTRNTRRNIALDYINTVPLAARGGYGEVNGIGDGLKVWYDADVKEVNELLLRPSAVTGKNLAAQALAYKQVLSLFLAQRRPSYYLGGGEPKRLNDLANVYLELLAREKIIRPELRDAATATSLHYAPAMSARGNVVYASDKAVNVTRTRLTTMLGLKSLYELDRIDLSVNTTFDQSMQKIASDALRRMKDPEAARAAGLFGERLLNENNDLSKVIYSFTLMERTPTANLVRIQADNFDQPFDINEGVKLDLGSSAKLRTLVSYLNIIAALHEQYSGLSVAELAKVEVAENNALARWSIDYLRAHPSPEIADMLSAAMDRKYSASPGEQFYTGGGVHTFANFDKLDNGKIVTVREAMRNSINLPFVRLMRDIVRYHMLQVPGSSARLLEDVHDERRSGYLERFADKEGSAFMQHFYRKYKGKSAEEILDLLLSSTRLTPPRLALIYNRTVVEPNIEAFTRLFHERLPDNKLSDDEIAALYQRYGIDRYNLPDQGYIARIHPLELWTAAYLLRNPGTKPADLIAASTKERQEVYNWLRKTRHKNAQDIRIRQLLEMEAFLEIHKEWKQLGYPFDSLVPSYATSIGSSADRPAALAELMGILINDGVRLPTVRIENMRFAADTPYETVVKHQSQQGEQVLSPAVAAEVRKALRDVVDNGTARRLKQPFADADGNLMVVGGKTGTGDHRYEVYGGGGQLIKSTVMNRTATFVFYIGDRYFGTITAFVPGTEAENYHFTSGLPVQLLKTVAPELAPYLSEGNNRQSSLE